MGHYNHPRELESAIAQEAVRRIIGTGATVRIQAPLTRNLLRRGLIRPYLNGGYHPGGMDIDKGLHPIGRSGLTLELNQWLSEYDVKIDV